MEWESSSAGTRWLQIFAEGHLVFGQACALFAGRKSAIGRFPALLRAERRPFRLTSRER